MSNTRLWLVRHGQTDWNAQGRIQGHTQTELNALGLDQARELAIMLGQKPFVAIYCSDLLRAIQTAEPLSAALHLPIQTTPLLRERDLGPYVGLLESQAEARRSSHGAAAGDLADWTNVPDVESDAAMWSRVDASFKQILTAHSAGDVLIVTHGGVLARTVQQSLGIPPGRPRRFSLANGMVAIIDYRKDLPYLLTLADLALVLHNTATADTSSVPPPA